MYFPSRTTAGLHGKTKPPSARHLPFRDVIEDETGSEEG